MYIHIKKRKIYIYINNIYIYEKLDVYTYKHVYVKRIDYIIFIISL